MTEQIQHAEIERTVPTQKLCLDDMRYRTIVEANKCLIVIGDAVNRALGDLLENSKHVQLSSITLQWINRADINENPFSSIGYFQVTGKGSRR